MSAEQPTFDRDAWRTARRPHTCCECRGGIVKGERYYLLVGVWDGDFQSFRYHRICHELVQAQRAHLRRVGVQDEDIPAIGELLEVAIEDATELEDFPEYWPAGVYVGAAALRKHVAAERTRELQNGIGTGTADPNQSPDRARSNAVA